MLAFLWPFTYIINYLFPRFKNNNEHNDLIYFDFETTGLNPYKDKIIEYAFIQEFKDEKYDIKDIESYSDNTYINSLVNPETKFDKKITQITGIHPDELDIQYNINICLPNIMHFINYNMKTRNIYMVAHNCDGFDKLFLINNIKNYNIRFKTQLDYKHIKFIDSINLCKKLFPQLKSYSLKNMTTHFNISSGTHRAMSDTIALKELFHKLINKLAEEIDCTSEYLLDNPKIIYEYIY